MITSVKAAERFDNTSFANEIVDGLAHSIYATYICPQCREQIGFQKLDFERARNRNRWTNLPAEAAKSFDDFAREHLGNTREYLDWVCPGCGLATRVYVQFWAGGKHGDAGINLLDVLENDMRDNIERRISPAME